jgi:hypothetical protein
MTDDKSLKEDARQCAIMKLPTDRRYQLRSTDLRGMNWSTCNTMQGKSGQAREVCGCLATPPKLTTFCYYGRSPCACSSFNGTIPEISGRERVFSSHS